MPRRSHLLFAAPLLIAAAVALVAVVLTTRSQTVAAGAEATRARPIGARSVVTPIPQATVNGSVPTPPAGSPPIAVMVDNYVDARPQYGLAEADVVYEALVEGGITRFEAVYFSADA